MSKERRYELCLDKPGKLGVGFDTDAHAKDGKFIFERVDKDGMCGQLGVLPGDMVDPRIKASVGGFVELVGDDRRPVTLTIIRPSGPKHPKEVLYVDGKPQKDFDDMNRTEKIEKLEADVQAFEEELKVNPKAKCAKMLARTRNQIHEHRRERLTEAGVPDRTRQQDATAARAYLNLQSLLALCDMAVESQQKKAAEYADKLKEYLKKEHPNNKALWIAAGRNPETDRLVDFAMPHWYGKGWDKENADFHANLEFLFEENIIADLMKMTGKMPAVPKVGDRAMIAQAAKQLKTGSGLREKQKGQAGIDNINNLWKAGQKTHEKALPFGKAGPLFPADDYSFRNLLRLFSTKENEMSSIRMFFDGSKDDVPSFVGTEAPPSAWRMHQLLCRAPGGFRKDEYSSKTQFIPCGDPAIDQHTFVGNLIQTQMSILAFPWSLRARALVNKMAEEQRGGTGDKVFDDFKDRDGFNFSSKFLGLMPLKMFSDKFKKMEWTGEMKPQLANEEGKWLDFLQQLVADTSDYRSNKQKFDEINEKVSQHPISKEFGFFPVALTTTMANLKELPLWKKASDPRKGKPQVPLSDKAGTTSQNGKYFIDWKHPANKPWTDNTAGSVNAENGQTICDSEQVCYIGDGPSKFAIMEWKLEKLHLQKDPFIKGDPRSNYSTHAEEVSDFKDEAAAYRPMRKDVDGLQGGVDLKKAGMNEHDEKVMDLAFRGIVYCGNAYKDDKWEGGGDHYPLVDFYTLVQYMQLELGL